MSATMDALAHTDYGHSPSGSRSSNVNHQEPYPPRQPLKQKRDFANAFNLAFDGSKGQTSRVPERHNQFYEKYDSPSGLRTTRKKLSKALEVAEAAEETTGDKFKVLFQSAGACASATVDLAATLVFRGSKALFSFVTAPHSPHQEGVQQQERNKRRRINTETSIVNDSRQSFLKDKRPPAGEIFHDPSQLTRINCNMFDTRNLVASPAKDLNSYPTMSWVLDTPTTKKSRAFDTFEYISPSRHLTTPSKQQQQQQQQQEQQHLQQPSTLPSRTLMIIDTSLNFTTPQRRVASPIVPKTFKPPVTPSYDPRERAKIVPDSPLASHSSLKVHNLLEGMRRHKMGALNRSPAFQRYPSVHGGGNIQSSARQRDNSNNNKAIFFASPKIARAFRFNEARFSSVTPLRYPPAWNKPPRIELPEQARNAEAYHSMYMNVVAERKKIDHYVEDMRRAAEAEKAAKKVKKYVVEPLDPASVRQVEALWARRDDRTTVISAYRIEISVYDLRTLQDKQWLNDNIIDFYLSMVTDRSKTSNGKLPSCFAFSTHFFSTLQTRGYAGVARWAKRKGIDVTKQDFIFVPINRHNTHWCLAVINNRDMRFEFYDSMNGAGTSALDLLRDYMYEQTAATYPESNPADMGYDKYGMFSTLPCPQQQNSFDCGVFVSKMVEVLSCDRDIMSFSQSDMPNIRRRMAHEISTQHLLP